MAKTITIDGKKLKRLMMDKKINMSKASRDCGMTESYISNSCSYNYINRAMAQLLEIKYGVMLDDYKYVEPEPVPEPEKPVEQPVEAAPVVAVSQSGMTEDDWNRIAGMITATAVDYDKIEKAVAEGVVEAAHTLMTIEPVTRQIQQMLYAAIKGALAKIANERK